MTQTVKAYAARQHWGELLTKVFRKETRVVVEKSGIPVAALVSIDDLTRLQAMDSRPPASPVDPDRAAQDAEARRRNRTVPMDVDALFAPPSPEVIARRKAVYEQIQARRHQRIIAPLTAADLIHEARAQEEEAYGFGR
jgi:prevent-host-death family protein